MKALGACRVGRRDIQRKKDEKRKKDENIAESGERYHQAVIFTSCRVRSCSNIGGSSFAHRFDHLVADTVVADARAVDNAVAVGATGLEQPMAIGELVVEVDLTFISNWVLKYIPQHLATSMFIYLFTQMFCNFY